MRKKPAKPRKTSKAGKGRKVKPAKAAKPRKGTARTRAAAPRKRTKPTRPAKPLSELKAEALEVAADALVNNPTAYRAASEVMRKLGIGRRRAQKWLARARAEFAADRRAALDELTQEYAARWKRLYAEARAAGDVRTAARLLAQIQRLMDRQPADAEYTGPERIMYSVWDPELQEEIPWDKLDGPGYEAYKAERLTAKAGATAGETDSERARAREE